MTFTLHMLRSAHTRDELVLCWRYFCLCMQMKPNFNWNEARDAFKQRARELGLEWKQ